MIRVLFILLMCFPILSNAVWTGDGLPVGYISSCEIDLDKNGKSDLVFLVDTIKGRELIALLRGSAKGFKAFSLWQGSPGSGMHLRCSFSESTLKETSTTAATAPGKEHATNGSVIHLFKPESGAQAFFWEKSAFKKVVTAD